MSLDAYDRHQKELEEKLDERTASLIHLQRVALEHDSTNGETGGGTTTITTNTITTTNTAITITTNTNTAITTTTITTTLLLLF